MNEPENPSFEYLKVEVTRHSATDLYLKVPVGWRPNRHTAQLLSKAALEVSSYDWDNFGWENYLDVQGHKVVTEAEAKEYGIFDITKELPR